MDNKYKTRWRAEWTKQTKYSKIYSRMKKVLDEHQRVRTAFAFSPEQATQLMDLALRERKGFLSNFADKAIGKINDGELYGNLPGVDAEEQQEQAAIDAENREQALDNARLMDEDNTATPSDNCTETTIRVEV